MYIAEITISAASVVCMASVIPGMMARFDAKKAAMLTLHSAKLDPCPELDNCILTFPLEFRNFGVRRESRGVTVKPFLNTIDAGIRKIAEMRTKSGYPFWIRSRIFTGKGVS
jgi:hypothetical protein